MTTVTECPSAAECVRMQPARPKNMLPKSHLGVCKLMGRTVLERSHDGVQIETAGLKKSLHESQRVISDMLELNICIHIYTHVFHVSTKYMYIYYI